MLLVCFYALNPKGDLKPARKTYIGCEPKKSFSNKKKKTTLAGVSKIEVSVSKC